LSIPASEPGESGESDISIQSRTRVDAAQATAGMSRRGLNIRTVVPVVFDRELWNELCLLRFLDDARGALILGPVGVGKTHYVDLCVMPTWLLNPLRVRVIRLARSA
jgi:hypothetical protein